MIERLKTAQMINQTATRGSMTRHFSIWILLISLLSAALLSLAGRILLSQVELFKADIEQELADYGITGVSLETIRGGWKGLHPQLKVQGAALTIPGRSQALAINELELSVKLIPSLWNSDLILESFHTTIEKLILVRDRQGLWWLNDIPLNTPGIDSAPRPDYLTLLKRLPDFISVDIQLLEIHDLTHDVKYKIRNSSLKSSRQNQKMALELLANLPGILGNRFKFQMIGDELKQQAYIETGNLDLVRLIQLVNNFDIPLSKARMSLQSWIDLEKFKIVKLVNKVNINQMHLIRESPNAASLNVSFQQKIQQGDDNWRIDTSVNRIFKGGLRLSGFDAQLLFSKKGYKPQLWLSALKAREVSALIEGAVADEALKEMLAAIEVNGDVENLVAELNMKQIRQSLVGLNFRQFQSRAYQSIPGTRGLSGNLVARNGLGHFRLAAENMALDFPTLFRSPLEFDEMSASVTVSSSGAGIVMDASSFDLSNRDIKVRGRAWLETNNKKSRPFMSLRAFYEDGKAVSTSKYLPVGIMPKKTVGWLDSAILGGGISQGDLLFHGRLRKLSDLEKNKSGVFHALFKLNEPRVKFLPKWPEVNRGQGLASFHNTSMDLTFSEVEIASSRVDRVEVAISNLANAELHIHTETKSSANGLLDTLSAMPVLNFFDKVKKENQKISGLIDTKVNLYIPLTNQIKKKMVVKATASLQNVGLSIPDWMVEFEKLNGVIDIDHDKVRAKDITGLYFGEESNLTVHPDSKKKRTILQLKGNLDSHKLLAFLPGYLQNPVSGKSQWLLDVSLAHQPSEKIPWINIRARSELSGTKFDFPQPAAVTRQEKTGFEFSSDIMDDNEMIFKVILEDRIKAEGRIKAEAKTNRVIEALDVKFGRKKQLDSDRELPGKGIHLSGFIADIDINEWSRYLKTHFSQEILNSSKIYPQIQNVDMTIQQLNWANQQVRDARLNIKNDASQLVGDINSSLAKGTFTIPFNMTPKTPLMARMEYIQLHKTQSSQKYEPEIGDMPNLHITSAVVSFEDKVFSAFSLKTMNKGNKFIVEELNFSRDEVHLKSSGNWQYNPQTNEHVSVFNLAVKGNKFGQTVSSLGLGETLHNGKIVFNGQIGWAGSLYHINWPSLIGEANLSLKDGFLKNVDPGAGRFVGLLSLNALPKRLSLNFGDVLLEGMQFDKIVGRFMINGEVMSTTNASMRGASAKVKIYGNTNLRNKTYDQTMLIIPRLSDTLPVIGTLAAGSSVGWGLLLFQQIFKKPFEKSVEIEYKVTGTWQQPELTLIPKPKPEVRSSTELMNEK